MIIFIGRLRCSSMPRSTGWESHLYAASPSNDCFFFLIYRQKEKVRDKNRKEKTGFENRTIQRHPAAKAAERTRGARRPPSLSGPRPFTRRAAGLPSAPPRRLSLPRCAAVYAEQFLRAAGFSSTCSGSTEGVATSTKTV